MRVVSRSFEDGSPIPPRYALGKPDPNEHVRFSDNQNPHLAWSDLPPGTRSLAIIVRDVDVPSSGERVNKEGMTVPFDLARVDFYHWVLVDLEPTVAPIEEGEFAAGVIAHGKAGPAGPRGTRQGLNDYTGWFRGDPGMEGRYFGYDGPCPPWNDERIHRYHFALYALDCARCPVEGPFGGADVRAVIKGHVLAQATISGTYAIYANARMPS
jgi:Raf kinase inhibitor-like YbhB/YbcL family protein